MARKDDAVEYLRRFPDGEAKTVRIGFMRVPFWRCRPVKGLGQWSALQKYTTSD